MFSKEEGVILGSALLLMLISVAIIYQTPNTQDEINFNDVEIYTEPTEKEYVYVPLDCVVDKYYYDAKCYEDSINGNS